MNAPLSGTGNWVEANQKWLAAELDRLRQQLASPGECPSFEPFVDCEFRSGLDQCALLFGLSMFERDLLLLAAGVELDSKLRQVVVDANSRMTDRDGTHPSFALAFATLPGAHWDAMSPQAPLRRWKLVELKGAHSVALQPLHVDERILHFISGVPSFDERLQGLVRLMPPGAEVGEFARALAPWLGEPEGSAPLLILEEDVHDPAELMARAEEVLAAIPAPGLWAMARDLPADSAELADLVLRIDREASLGAAIPVVELEPDASDIAEQKHRVSRLFSELVSPALLLAGRDHDLISRIRGRKIIRANVPRSDFSHARTVGSESLAPAFGPALEQFRLTAATVAHIVERVDREAPVNEEDEAFNQRVWHACREGARGGLDALAQRVESRADFNDLVLPEAQLRQLREIAQHLRHRSTVYDDWGMMGKTVRGQGLCVAFVGESGTGKTYAAEAIANEAMLDLYRIDLATVVSKYIGETEKNLKRLFDAAEASGAVLLFDEADALFGKRSDVKDSHDRYANIEIAYLLLSIESYRGLAILCTNFRSALDRAFLRRIRFIVQFPFPDQAARADIWRRELPETAPLADIDFNALSRMQMSGGHIRTVALNAAFMAAGEGDRISMRHLRQAAQREAAKLERPLLEARLGAPA